MLGGNWKLTVSGRGFWLTHVGMLGEYHTEIARFDNLSNTASVYGQWAFVQWGVASVQRIFGLEFEKSLRILTNEWVDKYRLAVSARPVRPKHKHWLSQSCRPLWSSESRDYPWLDTCFLVESSKNQSQIIENNTYRFPRQSLADLVVCFVLLNPWHNLIVPLDSFLILGDSFLSRIENNVKWFFCVY